MNKDMFLLIIACQNLTKPEDQYHDGIEYHVDWMFVFAFERIKYSMIKFL